MIVLSTPHPIKLPYPIKPLLVLYPVIKLLTPQTILETAHATRFCLPHPMKE